MREVRGVTVVVVLTLGLLLVVGCSSGPKSSHDRSQVQSVLRQAGYPAATAKCATDRVFAALTDGELRQLMRQGDSPTASVSPTLRQKVMTAIRGCVDASTSSTSSSVASSTTSAPSSSG
ncbi:MAG TPA: hypothetical protein VHA73_07300 [Acidimicrobiales bacterium]|jgi:hypothetical protein|nr:hypothetical protein [Acidimicrobiales bacterium]